jgi:hypothetical protein
MRRADGWRHSLELLALISTVLPLSGCYSRGLSPHAIGSSAESKGAPRGVAPLHFTDVTEPAGIHFRHTNGGFGRKYLPETMGSGCAFLDFDNDGWLDILLLNDRSLAGTGGAANGRVSPEAHMRTAALYRNNHDGTFTDVTHGSGLDVPMYAMGCCVGDYDNDGQEDVFVTTCLEPNRLFHNEGGGKFRDVTAPAGVGDSRWGTSCAWVDYDNDGRLDLFVCNYLRFRSLNDDKFCSLVANRKSYCPPSAYAGEACLLYHNDGQGRFSDVSAATGIARHVGSSLGVALMDFDHDGWLDLAVANDESPNYLFHNVARGSGGRTFEEVGVESGFAVAETGKPKAGMGIDAADYRNDGTLGVLVSNFSNEGLSFYRAEAGTFSETAFASGFGEPSLLTLGFGLFFFDGDNDGSQDAFVANGHVNDDIQLVQSNLSYAQRPLLFHNQGNGSFLEVGRQAGAPFLQPAVSRGAAVGDYDNDGHPDILVTNNNGPAELLRNDGSAHRNWLQVELRGRGSLSGDGTNRSGIGARVRVKAGKRVQTDWVRSGSSYLSQSMLRCHFGLGSARRADWIEVTWTTGRRQRLENVPANQRVVIEEGKGLSGS